MRHRAVRWRAGCYVRQVLDRVNGNKTRAARILGIDRRSLYRRLEEPLADHDDGRPHAPKPSPAELEPAPSALP